MGVLEPPEFPQWTVRRGFGKVGGRFPLALEAVGQRMIAMHVLPQVTNATAHPRYYAFFCWVFEQFEQRVSHRLQERQVARGQRAWRAYLEHALRACSLANDPQIRQLIGSQKAVRIGGVRRDARVTFPSKSPSGFDPANYGAAFLALGLGFRQNGRYHLTPMGRTLAEAFRGDLLDGMSRRQERALEVLLSRQGDLAYGVLQDLSPRLCIRALSSVDREHRPLIDMFFRHERDEPSDRARANGLALLLNLVADAKGSIATAEDLYPLFATARYSDGRIPRLANKALEETFAIWQRYMERQSQKTGFNALWHEVLNLLERHDPLAVSASFIVEHMIKEMESSSALMSLIGARASAISVSEALAVVSAKLPTSVHSRAEKVLRLTEEASDQECDDRVGVALVLLLTVVARWEAESLRLTPLHIQLHSFEGPARLTLPWLAQEVRNRGDLSLQELLRWLVEWCILAQSVRVAYEKLDEGDRFFILPVDGGYRLAHERQDPQRYFAYDSSRLRGALSILVDLELLRRTKNGLSVTPLGKAVFQNLRK
jgi:hypothetical protein